MNMAPANVTPPRMKNMPGAPIASLCTMNYIVMAFSSKLRNNARTHSPSAVSTATSAGYIQAMGP